MSEEDPMSWLDDPSQSLVPTASRASGAPTEDELREELANAPAAPAAKAKPKGKSDERVSERDGERTDQAGEDGAGADAAASSSGGGGGRPTRRHGEIFDKCPVTPLGVNGDLCFYLDVLGQLRAVKKHESQTIQSLFGHQIPKLRWHFPQWRHDKDTGATERVHNRFDQQTASMVMFEAVSECGVFNPDNSVRGVGAWVDDEGHLVYHLGDAVLTKGKKHKPGKIDKRIYPAAPPIPHPDDNARAPDPVPEIMKTLQTWNWANPDMPFIALGMIGTQILCGALDWRPVFWLLAPAASGKSEFQRLLKLLHGDDGLIQSNDATERGITSKLKHSSLPVAIDELEPGDERSTKERDIIKLARVAASGGEWFRGSADQSSVGGKVYSAFLFSSILIPGVMKTQDVQRLIRLELNPLRKGTVKLNLVPKTWRARGARLKQLLIQRWDTWPERLAAWRGALEVAGVTGRDADNWGTVLAMANMAQQEELPGDEVLANWAKKVAYMANADRDDTMNDSEAMLLHLMAQPLDVYRRGELHTVAQYVMAAASLPGRPTGLLGDGMALPEDRRSAGNTILARIGLRVSGSGEEAKLFIANQRIHGLNELFRGTEWHGGVWKQSAGRIPGAEATPNPLTLAGIRSRGFQVPIKSIPGLTSFPMDRDEAQAQRADQAEPSHLDDWG